MPIFEYKCEECRNVIEVLESSADKREHACPDCGSEKMTRLLSVFSGKVKESRTASASCATCTDGSCPLR